MGHWRLVDNNQEPGGKGRVPMCLLPMVEDGWKGGRFNEMAKQEEEMVKGNHWYSEEDGCWIQVPGLQREWTTPSPLDLRWT